MGRMSAAQQHIKAHNAACVLVSFQHRASLTIAFQFGEFCANPGCHNSEFLTPVKQMRDTIASLSLVGESL